MSAVIGRTATRRGAGTGVAPGIMAAAVGLFGVMFLLSRPTIAPLGSPGLAVGYAMLGAMSLMVVAPGLRVARRAARLRDPWVPLAIGSAAVITARLISGAAPPVPVSAAVVGLNLAAAVAEEAFFRGFLYGRLEGWGVRAAVVGSAVAFGLIHLPLYGWAAFPIDLGAGLLLSWQRAASGRWTVPAGTHALANLLAVLR
jgi:membrane protease YdiL (CAAX protease family)